MAELGMSNFMMFFVIIGVGMVFIIIWIVKSEARMNVARSEIARLNEQIETYERDRVTLREKISALESSRATLTDAEHIVSENIETKMRENVAALEKENERLRSELEEARVSLEEVYKALSS